MNETDENHEKTKKQSLPRSINRPPLKGVPRGHATATAFVQRAEPGWVRVSMPDVAPRFRLFCDEEVWAEPLGDDLYRLKSVPCFACGYSKEDLVRATANDVLTVESKVQSGGHSTVRIIAVDATAADGFWRAWPGLEAFGCAYEWFNGVFVVDVPKEAHTTEVRAIVREHGWNVDGPLAAGDWAEGVDDVPRAA